MLDLVGASLDSDSDIPSPFEALMKDATLRGRFTDYVPLQLQLEFKNITNSDKLVLLSWFLQNAKGELHKNNEKFWNGILLLLTNDKVTVTFRQIQVDVLGESMKTHPSFEVTIPDLTDKQALHCVSFAGEAMDNLLSAHSTIRRLDSIQESSLDNSGRYQRTFQNQLSLVVSTTTDPRYEEPPFSEVGVLSVKKQRSELRSEFVTTTGFTTVGTIYPRST